MSIRYCRLMDAFTLVLQAEVSCGFDGRDRQLFALLLAVSSHPLQLGLPASFTRVWNQYLGLSQAIYACSVWSRKGYIVGPLVIQHLGGIFEWNFLIRFLFIIGMASTSDDYVTLIIFVRINSFHAAGLLIHDLLHASMNRSRVIIWVYDMVLCNQVLFLFFC
jgi:hypothetical protein